MMAEDVVGEQVVGKRGRMAVIAPSTNTVVEHDLAMIRPEGVTFHTGRMYIANPSLDSDVAFERLLGEVRHWPAPGTRYSAWMLAAVEASRGDSVEADRILAEPPHADHAWSLYLRGRIAEDDSRRDALLQQALEKDPRLYPAHVALGIHAVDRGEIDAGVAHLQAAREIRPWDPEIHAAIARAQTQSRGESSP